MVQSVQTIPQLEYKESKLTIQQRDMQQHEINIQDGKTSIFSMSYFPWVTRQYKFTPQQLKDAQKSYQDSLESITSVLEKHGIERAVYYDLCEKYSEILESHRQCLVRKAKEYNHAAIDMYLDNIPDMFIEKDRFGVRKLSGPGVKYMKDKHDALAKQAAIHDRDTYGDKQSIDLKSRSVNVNINRNITAEETPKELDDLIQIISRK